MRFSRRTNAAASLSPSSLTLSTGTLSPHQARTGKAPSRHVLPDGERWPIVEIADALERACRVSSLRRETMESIHYSEGAHCADRRAMQGARLGGLIADQRLLWGSYAVLYTPKPEKSVIPATC